MFYSESRRKQWLIGVAVLIIATLCVIGIFLYNGDKDEKGTKEPNSEQTRKENVTSLYDPNKKKELQQEQMEVFLKTLKGYDEKEVDDLKLTEGDTSKIKQGTFNAKLKVGKENLVIDRDSYIFDTDSNKIVSVSNVKPKENLKTYSTTVTDEYDKTYNRADIILKGSKTDDYQFIRATEIIRDTETMFILDSNRKQRINLNKGVNVYDANSGLPINSSELKDTDILFVKQGVASKELPNYSGGSSESEYVQKELNRYQQITREDKYKLEVTNKENGFTVNNGSKVYVLQK